MVFAKSYCPYSVKTRELLESLEPTFGFKFHIIDIDLLPEDDGPVIQMELLQLTGQKTVPNIFIGQKHIGGNSDLQDLKLSGMLDKMLRKVIKERSFAHHKRRGPFDFNEDALSL
jgi:glutaredoxin 3